MVRAALTEHSVTDPQGTPQAYKLFAGAETPRTPAALQHRDSIMACIKKASQQGQEAHHKRKSRATACGLAAHTTCLARRRKIAPLQEQKLLRAFLRKEHTVYIVFWRVQRMLHSGGTRQATVDTPCQAHATACGTAAHLAFRWCVKGMLGNRAQGTPQTQKLLPPRDEANEKAVGRRHPAKYTQLPVAKMRIEHYKRKRC